MNQDELRRFVNTDLFRQGSGDSGCEKAEIRDYIPSGSENISPRYLTNTLVKRKQSRSQKRSVSRGSSRGGTPESALKRFNPRTDGFRHLFNSARRLHVNSDNGKISWNEIRNVYRKETGRHLNSEELNLICGTAHQTKHDLLTDQLSLIFDTVDSKGLFVRLNTSNTPPTIAEDQESSSSPPISPQNLPAEENLKLMEVKRKEITENLIRRGLLTSEGRRPSDTDSASTETNDAAEDPDSKDQAETKEECTKESSQNDVTAPIEEVDLHELKEEEKNTSDIETISEMEETTVEVAFEKENTEVKEEITVDPQILSENVTEENDHSKNSCHEHQADSTETINKDDEQRSPVIVVESTIQKEEELSPVEETGIKLEETKKEDLIPDIQTNSPHHNTEETKSIYENVIDENEEKEETTESTVTIHVELAMDENENREEEWKVLNVKNEETNKESAYFESSEGKNGTEDSEDSPVQETSECVITISEDTPETELKKERKAEEAQLEIVEAESDKEEAINVVVSEQELFKTEPKQQEEDAVVSTTTEDAASVDSVSEELSLHQEDTVDTLKPEASESSFTTVTVEVELSKKFECVTTASLTAQKENVVVCHFERKIEKSAIPVSTEILSVETEVLPSSSIPELSPTIELEQRPMNIAVVSNGALSPAGAPVKKEKKVRIRLPGRRIFGCCSIF